MNRREAITYFSSIMLVFLLIGCGNTSNTVKEDIQRSIFYDGNLRWISVDVCTPNQGDAHFITKNDKSILIDGGLYDNGKNKLIPFLKNAQVSVIDEVMINHPHSDHYGGIKALLEDDTIEIKKLSMNMPTEAQMKKEYWGGTYKDLVDIRKLATDRNITISTIKQGYKFMFDKDSYLEVLYVYDGINTPVGITDINDMSAITMIYDNNNRFLLAGDLNNKLGSYLAKNAMNISADVLKVPHHAAEGLAPNSFFDKVNAKEFIITAPAPFWDKNWTRSQRVRNYVIDNNINTYINGFHGNITVLSNNSGYTISVDNP